MIKADKRKREWVIHFSADDFWHSNPHSRHHITEQLHRHYSILWINPIGSRMPSLKKRNTTAKIFRKLKSLVKYVRKVSDGFYVITFIQIPYFKDGWLQRLNHMLIRIQLKATMRFLEIRDPLLFYTSPIFANTLKMIKHRFSVYYYSDLYTEFREFNEATRAFTIKMDRILNENSDLVMCASQKIFQSLDENLHYKTIYFPHQVDFSFFHNHQPEPPPEDIAGISRPIVGYYGTVSDSNDWELIGHSVRNRPQYNFVFIGRKDIQDTGLEHLPNVHFLGMKPYEEIPSYGRCFDVGIMFWIRREWIINSSPLKLKEYLSMGIPVVSTLIEEVETYYKGIVYSAPDKEIFLEYIDKAINNRDDNRIRKGIELVKNDSWYNAVKIIQNEMDKKESLLAG